VCVQLVPPALVREYHNRILNIHPALLPSFGGKGFYGQRVHKAVIASGAKVHQWGNGEQHSYFG
jgi:folate-dependent phosphoribosylglycinamide formyltransferase PurN